MTKTVLVFVILVLFVAITVWFVIQKTKEVNKAAEIPAGSGGSMPTATSALTPTPEANAPVQQVQGKPVQYDNGLIVQDLVVGNGKSAQNGDTLSAHYSGTLENGTVFDSSYGRGQPIQFVLGSGQLIKGWELGLIGMKEGGKRKLIIPPSLGYGAQGAGGIIPPNATLIFEIELVSVTSK